MGLWKTMTMTDVLALPLKMGLGYESYLFKSHFVRHLFIFIATPLPHCNSFKTMADYVKLHTWSHMCQ